MKEKGWHWFNNGKQEKQFKEPPEDWIKGRLPKGHNQPASANERRRQYNLTKKVYKKFHLTDQQKQNLSNAKLKYYGGLK